MKFQTFFKSASFAVVLCGLLSLYVTGGVGIVYAACFVALAALAWRAEDSRFQLSDKLGTALVVLAIPLFYVVWRYRILGAGGSESAVAALLSRFILGLSMVKLFQKKRDRDWLFLYLMAFFEVLLSAALSISPLYLAVLLLYLLVTSVAVIAFEINKSARLVQSETTESQRVLERLDATPFRRLPTTAITLVACVMIFAAPVFFLLPRVGGAGFGANQSGITGMTGFSSQVRLGEIGRIQQSDETVMRVKVDAPEKLSNGLRWRGIALDQFDNHTWRQSRPRKMGFIRTERELFLVGTRTAKPQLVSQTFYIEPMDTTVLFALPRALVVQGSFSEIKKDEDDGLTATRVGMERINYTVQSDVFEPPAEQLRKDNSAYSSEEFRRFLQIPENLDPRITQLAFDVMKDADNRYDKAKSVETYLQTQFGYTLEQKASGDQPVADFLFNVREGHCEYFSSAMVLMLRSQGIAARVVNGFQTGMYNETADVFVVKQKDAHSWVEVYFPKDRVWVAFDPTPFAGQADYQAAGLLGFVGRYIDALETFWIQYFVAYDNREQKSLFRSVKDGFGDFQSSVSSRADDLMERFRAWQSALRGDFGDAAKQSAIRNGVIYSAGTLAAGAALIVAFRLLRRKKLLDRIRQWLARRRARSIVQFYDRLQRALARRGLTRESWQTPLEFALATGIPEAVTITERYNRVRFGEKDLTSPEAEEIDRLIRQIEHPETQ